jgi:hypothetical protein
VITAASCARVCVYRHQDARLSRRVSYTQCTLRTLLGKLGHDQPGRVERLRNPQGRDTVAHLVHIPAGRHQGTHRHLTGLAPRDQDGVRREPLAMAVPVADQDAPLGWLHRVHEPHDVDTGLGQVVGEGLASPARIIIGRGPELDPRSSSHT